MGPAVKEELDRAWFAAQLGANGDPKLNAVADFAARLLASPVAESVARIVLFGSVADGEARPESDIDLLVFGTSRLAELSTWAADAAFEVALETGESVEPLVYCHDVLHYPHYFVAHALRTGKEVYRMNESDLRQAEAEAV